MAEVGDHVTWKRLLIGPFQILDPEMEDLGHDECLHFWDSADHSHENTSLFQQFLAFYLAK